MLHGWSDPTVPPETVTAVADELTPASADWDAPTKPPHNAHMFHQERNCNARSLL